MRFICFTVVIKVTVIKQIYFIKLSKFFRYDSFENTLAGSFELSKYLFASDHCICD